MGWWVDELIGNNVSELTDCSMSRVVGRRNHVSTTSSYKILIVLFMKEAGHQKV